MNSIIYLRKTMDLEYSLNNKAEEYYSFFETPEEYIERIKNKSINSDVKRDIYFHLTQLVEISIDSQLVYQWIRLNSSQAKLLYFRSLLDENSLLDNLHYKNFHFSKLDFMDLPEKLLISLFALYKDRINEIHKYLLHCVDNIPDIHLESSKPNVTQLDNIVNSYINQGLCLHLGLRSTSYNNNHAISYDGKICNNFEYLNAPISQYNKDDITLTKIYSLESLFSNTSNDALDYFVEIWTLLGTSERKSKTAVYNSFTQEEIITKFYNVYSGLSKNFLEILINYDYENKRILTTNYHLKEHIRLVINYLYLQSTNSDYPLLEKLFQKNNLRSYYDKDYPSEKIKNFDAFIKEHQQ